MKAKEMKKMAIRIIVGAVVSVMAFGFLAPAFANAEEIPEAVNLHNNCANDSTKHDTGGAYHSAEYYQSSNDFPSFKIVECNSCGVKTIIYEKERLEDVHSFNEDLVCTQCGRTENELEGFRYISPSNQIERLQSKEKQRLSEVSEAMKNALDAGEDDSDIIEQANLELQTIINRHVEHMNCSVYTPKAIIEENKDDNTEYMEIETVPTVEQPEEKTTTSIEQSTEPVAQEVENPNPNTGNAPIMFGGVAVVSLGLIIVLACAVIAHRRESK